MDFRRNEINRTCQIFSKMGEFILSRRKEYIKMRMSIEWKTRASNLEITQLSFSSKVSSRRMTTCSTLFSTILYFLQWREGRKSCSSFLSFARSTVDPAVGLLRDFRRSIRALFFQWPARKRALITSGGKKLGSKVLTWIERDNKGGSRFES